MTKYINSILLYLLFDEDKEYPEYPKDLDLTYIDSNDPNCKEENNIIASIYKIYADINKILIKFI